jgi:hypothetical protein
MSWQWMRWWRGVCLGVTMLAMALFVLAIPVTDAHYGAPCHASSCAMALEAGQFHRLQAEGFSVDLYAALFVVLFSVFTLVFDAVALLLLLRQRTDPMALFAAMMLVSIGATFPPNLGLLASAYPAAGPFAGFLGLLGGGSLFTLCFLFPDGRFVPRWTVWLGGAGAIMAVLWQFGNPDSWPAPLELIPFFGIFLFGLWTQIYRYRRVSDAVQRQQTKWILFGLLAGLGGFICLVFVGNFLIPNLLNDPVGNLAGAVALYGCLLALPLCLAVAILRYRLYDIDVIVNRTLVYLTLTVFLALVYVGSTIALQAILRLATGAGSNVAIAFSTLMIAALFGPLRGRIQREIDRRFYRRKYDASKTLTAFSASVRDQVDLDGLTESLVSVVRESMQPVHVSLWLPDPGSEAKV